MENYWCLFKRKDSFDHDQIEQTVVGVKKVKQDIADEWDESMPLPGDIIEAFTDVDNNQFFAAAKANKADFSSQLGKICEKQVKNLLIKVRRGDQVLKLQVCVVQEKCSMLHKRFTIKATNDDRHVAVLGDLTFQQCSELQEMSRRFVNIVDKRGFNKTSIGYDWEKKLGKYLPDHKSTVVSSILFMPLHDEQCIEATVSRSMAWFSAAISSGIPLVFVNIQTEQTILSERPSLPGKDSSWCRKQNHFTIQPVQAIRLWFLPGTAEVELEMMLQKEESRFGIDIKRTEEGFLCVDSVSEYTAADRAGLTQLYEEANVRGHLLVISRLQGKSLTPSSVSSDGRINCCDHAEVRDTLTFAIEEMEDIQLHVMAWPSHSPPITTLQVIGAETLRPPPME